MQDKALRTYFNIIQSEDYKIGESDQLECMFQRYKQFSKEYQNITDKWENEKNIFNNKEDQKYNELIKQQEEELTKFYAKSSDQEFLRPFTKPSSRLNSMREQERCMAVAKMYQMTKEVKLSADELQNEELLLNNVFRDQWKLN